MKKEIKDCCECPHVFSWQGWQGTGRFRLKWMLTHFAFELIWGLLVLGRKHIGIMVELRKGPIPSSPFSTICFFVHLIESIASNASCRRLVGLFHSKSQWVLIGLMVRTWVRVVGCICPLPGANGRRRRSQASSVSTTESWHGTTSGPCRSPLDLLDREIFRLEVGILSKIKSFAVGCLQINDP